MPRPALSLFWWSPSRQPLEAARQLWGFGPEWFWASMYGGQTFRNFGDALSPLLFSYALAGSVSVNWRAPGQADFYGLGSILDQWRATRRKAFIWGSGFSRIHHRDLSLSATSAEQNHILAVRGALTRDALGVPSHTPLGDPAILLNEILRADVQRESGRRRGVIVIPHYFDFSTSANRQILRTMTTHGIRIVSPLRPWREVLKQINESELVLSSSLHGKIVADALGVPAIVLRFDTSDSIDKYEDYMSVWERPICPISAKDALERIRNPRVLRNATSEVTSVAALIGERSRALTAALRNAVDAWNPGHVS